VRYSIIRTTPPTLEPVTLAQFSVFAGITDASQNALLSDLITAARVHLEDQMRRCFVTTTCTYYADRFPSGRTPLALARSPLLSIMSVKYYNNADVLTTWSSANYRADTRSEPGRVEPIEDLYWPTDVRNTINAVEVAFVAGFGSSEAAAVAATPRTIKTAVMVLAKSLYEYREGIVTGTIVAENPVIASLIDSNRVYEFV